MRVTQEGRWLQGREGATGLVQVGGLAGWTRRAERVGKGSFLEGTLPRCDWLQAFQERLAGEEHGALAGVWA